MRLRNIIKNWRKNEWQIITIAIIIGILCIITPFIFGHILAKDGASISGLHTLAPVDLNVYYSYINQVKDGNILLHNQFTTETQAIGVFNIAWLFIGQLAKIPFLNVFWTLKIAQIFSLIFLIFVIYIFASTFTANLKKRRWILFLALFGSGLGAYFDFIAYTVNDIYHRPADLWMPEATIFNTIFHVPHFILASALIFLILLFMRQALETKKYYYSFLAGLMALILFNFHPYHLPIIYLVPLTYGIYLLIEKRIKLIQLLGHLIVLGLISLPSILYHFYTLTDPIIKARSLQNITLSSPFYFYLLGLGIYFFLFLGGLFLLGKNRLPKKYFFLLSWILITIFLLYLPDWQFQRRNIQGIFLAFVIFSVECLYYLIAEKKITFLQNYFWRQPMMFVLILLLLFAPSSFLLQIRDLGSYYNKSYYYYISAEKNAAFAWLNQAPHGTVLSSQITSSFIPAQANQIVFYGHDHETINSDEKESLTIAYFSQQMNQNQEVAFFTQQQISYLWWDDITKIKYPEFNPDEKKYLQSVFSEGTEQVYIFIN